MKRGRSMPSVQNTGVALEPAISTHRHTQVSTLSLLPGEATSRTLVPGLTDSAATFDQYCGCSTRSATSLDCTSFERLAQLST